MEKYPKRYDRNMTALTAEENMVLRSFKVCVAGCGGLGGYVIEMLCRLGVGQITAVDGDAFDETNLNRQLLSQEQLIGRQKALAAKDRMALVNSEVIAKAITDNITEENANEIIGGNDIVIDALDNISSRMVLAKACAEEGIPLIHGAVAGWFGQVCVIMPGSGVLEKVYSQGIENTEEADSGNTSFAPACVAAIEVAEAVKVLLKKGDILNDKLLCMDLLSQDYEIVDIGGKK